ncbi:MAG TPA: lysylphosphatidylglycerol synthase domain-containing protein [Solirubrobacteraceae bacterium]|nr:lysylphosphatidylglycerol synthase domain-containing protein [Solirubrobacteraceae bacterium]
MPPPPTNTNVDGQRHQALPAARVVRRGVCPASRAERAGVGRSAEARGSGRLGRRVIGAVVLATATVTLLLAVPPLRGVAHQISRMSLAWIGAAVVLEVASCAAYVVIFRLFFAAVPAGLARQLAWTEEASGALLPTGGLGALAIGGWLLRQAGMSTRCIVESSSSLFFLTSGMNVAALVVGGVMLSTDAFGGHDTLILAGAPIALAAGSTWVTLALPVVVRRAPHRRWPRWLLDVCAGIQAARHSLVAPSWRMLGAVGYLGFDIAALGALFAATGHPIPVDALILGYVIGYIANMLPVPGGFGVLEGGLAGMLIAYGAPATCAVAAVVVYHAIAFWIPSLGGLVGYALLRRRDSHEGAHSGTAPGQITPTITAQRNATLT